MNGRTRSHDDAALVRRVAAGSEAAVAEAYDGYGAAIFAAVYRLTADRGIAEEVVQETMLTLWNRAESYDPAAGSLAAWLLTIARNRAIDRLRAAGRRPAMVGLPFDASDEDPAVVLDRLVAGGAAVTGAMPPPGPEAALELADRLATIRDEIARLPDEERLAILLAYQEELTQAEIAERLGWPLGTVKTRTRRALRRLREALGPEFQPIDAGDVPVRAGEDR